MHADEWGRATGRCRSHRATSHARVPSHTHTDQRTRARACIRQVREIPLFHGDQWEATVPSLLGLAPEDHVPGVPRGVDKDGNLLRMDSKIVLQKAHQEMNHLKRHFLVVVFAPLTEEPAKDEDPVISTDITDNRQNFLGQCQMSHWQFSTLRHAQVTSRHPSLPVSRLP